MKSQSRYEKLMSKKMEKNDIVKTNLFGTRIVESKNLIDDVRLVLQEFDIKEIQQEPEYIALVNFFSSLADEIRAKKIKEEI